jgi:acyl carrier protein
VIVDASAMAAIWSSLLDGIPVEPDSDFFFDLGGHSLLGVSIVSALAEHSGLPLELQDLYLSPTPREFAAHLEQLGSRLAQLTAQLPDPRDVDLEIFVTALIEFGAAAADTFLPEAVTVAYHTCGAVERTPPSSRLAVLRRARGRGACSALGAEGPDLLIRRDQSVLRVAIEGGADARTIHIYEG